MISVQQVALSFGSNQLFSDVSFTIHLKDRIGLVGKNGAGKSTLLKILAGLQKPDSGIITYPNDISIGYLPQQLVVSDNYTVWESAMQAFASILQIEAKINELNNLLAERTDFESDEYQQLIHQLTDLTDEYHIKGGATIHANVERTLIGLGFNPSDFNRPTRTFSGGWKMRIELAKILLRQTNLLLLDEPTNHLDIESIQWLEDYLKSYNGAAIIISHDRKFLDNVTNRTIEISLGKIYDYKTHYSKYVEFRAERRQQQLAAFRNQQKMIEDTQEFIDRFRYKATKAVQVQSRIKQLEKLERIEIDPEDTSSISIRFPTPIKSGKIVLDIKNVSKKYGNNEVLNNISLLIESGERVAFVGKNGEGKSTLSKIIVGEIEYEGIVKHGHQVKIGYFAQNQDELLDENLTVFETIDRVAIGEIRTKIRDILGAFLFSGEDIEKKVKVLSGGERSRLAIARLLLEPYNLLVLDEPTNHLDMRSKDILKQALLNYEGTLIIVSHDRDFLDGLVNKIYEFKNKQIFEHIGGIYDFLEKRKLQTLNELEARKTIEVKVPKESSSNKNQYFEKKEADKQIRRIQKQIEETESRITAIEQQIAEMDSVLATGKVYQDGTDTQVFFERYKNLKGQLDVELTQWEQLHEMLNELKVGQNN